MQPSAYRNRTAGAATLTGRVAAATWLIMVFALAVLAAFRSDKLVGLAWDLPPSPLSERIVTAAETWNGWMARIGIDEATRAALEAVAALRGRDGL